MVLIKKCKFFHVFILGKISQQNVFDDILEKKEGFLYYKKQKVKKVQKLALNMFSKGVRPLLWSKIWKFSIFSIIGKISQQDVFDDILERKKKCF